MNSQRRLTRQDVMPFVYREIQRVLEAIDRVCSGTHIFDFVSLDQEFSEEVVSVIECEWESVYEDREHLNSVRFSPLFLSLDVPCDFDDFHAELELAVSEIPICLRDPECDLACFDKSVAMLQRLARSLNDYCEYQAISAYGRWGAHWFQLAMERRPADETLSLEVASVDLSPEQIVSALSQSEPDDSSRASAEVRDEAFTWMYDLVMQGVPFSRIRQRLKSKPETWRRYGSDNGLRDAVLRWAIDNGLPEPEPRPPGRPPGS